MAAMNANIFIETLFDSILICIFLQYFTDKGHLADNNDAHFMRHIHELMVQFVEGCYNLKPPGTDL